MEANLPTAKSSLPPVVPEELPNTALPWMALDLSIGPLHSLSYGQRGRQDAVKKIRPEASDENEDLIYLQCCFLFGAEVSSSNISIGLCNKIF